MVQYREEVTYDAPVVDVIRARFKLGYAQNKNFSWSDTKVTKTDNGVEYYRILR